MIQPFQRKISHAELRKSLRAIYQQRALFIGFFPGFYMREKSSGLKKATAGQLLYQIVDGHNCDKHLHLKCVGCGKLLHMSDTASDAVLNDVLLSNHFAIDKEKTVLFGMCSQCERDREKGK